MSIPMKKILPAIALSGLSLTLGVCGCSSGTGARTIETGSSESITTVNHIDDQDWAKAATKLTNSMLSTEGLFTANNDGSKKRLAISRIINNTSEVVDTDLLVKKIRVTLFQSGKVVTTTIGGLTVEDPLAQKDKEKSDFATGDGNPNPIAILPDYTLSGKLIENQARAGDIRQSTFSFQLSLTNKNGDAVWEGEEPITKIGSRNSVGL